MMKKNTLFIAFAIFFLVASVYHIVAIFFKINTSPIWRNILFIFINLFTAWGLWKRPSLFIYFFAALMLQQLYSHGSDLINEWTLQNKIDYISILVLLLMPTIFVLLFLDKIGKLKKAPP